MGEEDYYEEEAEEFVAAPGVSWVDSLQEQFGAAPWWVISTVIHVVILMAMALITISVPDKDKDSTLIVQDMQPKQKDEYDPELARDIFKNPKEVPADEIVEHPVIVHEEVEVTDHFETDNDMDQHTARGQEDAISDIPLGGTGVVAYFGVGGGAAGCFGYRDGGGRKKCVARFGGSSATESAVEAALRWLAKHQEPDGRWDGEKYEGANTDPGITGLAMLAFLGAGYTQKVGKYKTTVSNAVKWMISQQDAQGCIGKGFAHGLGYHHAICSLSLAENYGMTRSPQVGAAAQKAIEWSIQQHQCEYSAWRYSPKQAPDTSVTGWFVMQLKSGKVAGLQVDGSGFQGAINWLDKVTTKPGAEDPYGGRVAYTEGRSPSITMTSVGMLCRQFMGWDRTDQLLRGGAEWLVTRVPNWDGANFYYWYYGTLVMFQMGGDYWKRWNAAMKSTLIQNQRKGGDEDGSWDPVGSGGLDRGGRVMSTALGACCLEVYYRYLPMYK